MRRIASLLVLLIALAAVALAWRSLSANMQASADATTAQRVTVAPGMSLRSILQRLQSQGAVRHARWVALYLRLQGRRPRIQAGTYEIAPHSSPEEILEQFASGRVLLAQLTIVEGWTFAQMRHALDADSDITHELKGASDARLMQALGHAGQYPEGRFFPDTYRFAAGTSDRRILELAYERMRTELAAAWAARAADLPVNSPDEALVLASIVEKETGREDERAKVAAVFVNRLRKGMRLQSDPTVIYGLGERYDGDIRSRDLVNDTPYNTYTRAGLPPTPIALPGSAALQATLHPENIDALYFVATGDGDARHHFSASLAEHDQALRHYLQNLGVRVNKRVGQ